MIGPLPAISRTETREYAMEIGGALYFAIFITIGAFIGINLLVVVVTTNLEQMMKAREHGQQNQINFSEVSEMGRAREESVCMNADWSICVPVCTHTLRSLEKAKPETWRHLECQLNKWGF